MDRELRPALIGSAALHLSILVAGLIAWPHFGRPLTATTVPVKLVARGPTPDVRPAAQAPEPAEAQAPEPVEAAPPPEPEPAPAPPQPAPVPKPTPPKPAPEPKLDLDALAKKVPKAKPKPQPKLDLDALARQKPDPKAQARLDLDALASRLPRPASGRRGETRAEQAPQSRDAVGAAQGLTADEASLLASKLNRLWNPNCAAEGASGVQVRVNIRLTQTGALAASPRLIGGQPGDPVWQAAAQRALTAVARGAPYDELPPDRYQVWKDINFNFNGRQACGGR